MGLKIYNSLSRKKETFVPLHEGRVHMYVCGPTVYDYPHIGHAKSYITFDIVVRYLRSLGYKVRYVQNITDVGHLLDSGEDRILRGARRERVEPMELVETYTRAYFEAMDKLNVLRPDISPRASGHVLEQIELAEKLIKSGNAYEADGSVYFDVESWPAYGKLTNRKVSDQQAGARVEVDENKRHPADFALWKKAEPDHVMQWNSPWGKGYPGWHLECSAMAMKYLGVTIDIHGGGLENQFPHHECEIAQSEAATGKPFVRYWMHHNMVLVDGTKMSKSLGNFATVGEMLEKFSGEQLRFFILQTHYRSPVDFSEKAISASSQGLERLHNTWKNLQRQIGFAPQGKLDPAVEIYVSDFQRQFESEMDDDFNTPAAIARLFDFARAINKDLDSDPAISDKSVECIEAVFKRLAGDILGLLPKQVVESVTADPFIELLVSLRNDLRDIKEWQLADKIRDKIAALGVILEDGKEGTRWNLRHN